MFRAGLHPLLVVVHRSDALSRYMSITNDTHEPVLITVPEAARRLAIGRTLTYELIAAHELPAVRIGRAIRVPADAIDAFVDRRLSEERSAVGS
jgi:excisionase family DNA binding protein